MHRLATILFIAILITGTHSVNAETEIQLSLEQDEKLEINTKYADKIPEITPEMQVEENYISKDEHEARMKFFTGINNFVGEAFRQEYSSNNTVTPLLTNKLTKHFDEGIIDSIHLWGVYQGTGEINIPEHGSTSKTYNPNLVNILLDTKMRNNKDSFRIMFDVSHQHSRPFFQQFIQDLYYENSHIPHHKIIIGNSRPGIIFEGSQSPYTLPLINRSQIARNFSTVRKAGIRLNGKYDFVEYDVGGYSSDTYFSEFFPGVEFDGFIVLKPFAKKENLGKLTTAASIITGKRNSTNYIVGSAHLGYEYKNFWTKAEFAISDGSNGASGLTDARRKGWSATIGYKLTKKLEAIARYDDFIPDNSNKSTHSREFTAGLNYYIKGQALKLAINYVFHQHDILDNSHRILVFTQIAL